MLGRFQLVQVGEACSQERNIVHRVPEGSGLSPLLFICFTADMPEAVVSATLVMYADDTSCYTVGKTVEESKNKLEIAAQEIMNYMEENHMHLNASKTEYMLFERNGGGSIKVGLALVKESRTLRLLGLTINKMLTWDDHITELERNLSQRIYALLRLRSYIPRKELLCLVTGFFNAKAVYMIYMFADPTGSIVHRLQVKQNKAIRAVMGINPKECIGKEELLKRSKLTGLDEMSLHANYMLAWRLFSPQGDLADLREGRLRQHQHDHSTRSVISGVVTQQATYDSLIKKSAVIFNRIREETKLCPSKMQQK
jgi:hypothetical protein